LRSPAEGYYHDRHRTTRAKDRRRLRRVDDDHHSSTGLLDHLFVQKGPACAFDEVQVGIYFVGSIDR
jgi:hypothetical protein